MSIYSGKVSSTYLDTKKPFRPMTDHNRKKLERAGSEMRIDVFKEKGTFGAAPYMRGFIKRGRSVWLDGSWHDGAKFPRQNRVYFSTNKFIKTLSPTERESWIDLYNSGGNFRAVALSMVCKPQFRSPKFIRYPKK